MEDNDKSVDKTTGSQTDYASSDGSKDDNSYGVDPIDDKPEESFFHVTTKYKWVLALSILMIAAEGIMIYAYVMGALAAEVWQVAIWGVGIPVCLYAIFGKSLAAVLFNLIMFVGVSLIPAWGMVYEFFRPVIELFK